MGAAGQYRVGPSDFFTPGDLNSDADTLNAQVVALDHSLDGNMRPPTDWFDAWNVWLARWKAFYNKTFGGGAFSDFFAALNDSNRDELVSWEKQFETWYSQAQGYGSALADGARVEPREKSGDSLDNHLDKLGLPSLNTLALLAAVIGGGYAAYKVLK